MVAERPRFDKPDAPIYLAERTKREALMSVQPQFRKLTLHRRDKDGMVTITCDELDGFFFSARKGWRIRERLERLLKLGYQNHGQNIRAYINGSVSNKLIHAVIEMTQKQEKQPVSQNDRRRLY